MSASPETAGSRHPRASAALLPLTVALGLVAAPPRAAAGDTAGAVQSGPATGEAGLDLALGRALFGFNWVSAPASTKSADGLGPLYNARSSAACHTLARRAPTDES